MSVDSLPEKSSHEHEASAWWSRQLYTSLLLANAGGVVAVAGFAGNTENSKLAAFFAYPAITFYLIGMLLTAMGVVAQFFYTSWRLEAIAEADRKRIARAIKDGESFRLNGAATFAFFVIMATSLASIGGGVLFFAMGAREIALSVAAMACEADGRVNCRSMLPVWGTISDDRKQRARRAAHQNTSVGPESSQPLSISPTAILVDDDQPATRRQQASMKLAAQIALRNHRKCKTVEIVEHMPETDSRFIVTCSTGDSLADYVVNVPGAVSPDNRATAPS